MSTNRISLSIISPELKEKLLNGKVLISSVLVSTGAFFMMSAKEIEEAELSAISSSPPENEECLEFNSYALFGKADNSLSFGEAFQTLRESLGPGGVFEYNNKLYNTYYKEEWDVMTEVQKMDYYSSIDKLIDYDTVTYNNGDGTIKSVVIDVNIDPDTGDVSVKSLTPDVEIESFTLSMNNGKLSPNEIIEDPETTEVSLDTENAFNDPFFIQDDDFIIDGGKTSIESLYTLETENNLVDPSEVEIEDDYMSEPEYEGEVINNITDSSLVDILEDDNLTDPSKEHTNDSDDIAEPSMDDFSGNNMTNDHSQSSEITIDEDDFDF